MEQIFYSPKPRHRGREKQPYSVVYEEKIAQLRSVMRSFRLNPFSLPYCRVTVTPRGICDCILGIRFEAQWYNPFYLLIAE